jgi:transposase InsO family protein
MDIMEPLPVSERGNRYVLVVMDYFTKWAEAYPLPNQEVEVIAEVFVTQFVCRYGVPSQIHTDRGRNFDSRLLQAVCKLLEIDKTLTSSYRPQSDGLVERMNRTLEDIVSKYVQYDQKDWDKYLPFALMAYRACSQETSGLSPNLLMFGREASLPLYFVAGRAPGTEGECVDGEYALKVRERLEVAFEIARESSHVAQQRQKRYYDAKVCGQPYKVGDKVWVYNPARTKGISPKLQRRWQGPCTILKKLSEANYVIKRPRARKTEVVHFDRLKPCYDRSSDENGLISDGLVESDISENGADASEFVSETRCEEAPPEGTPSGGTDIPTETTAKADVTKPDSQALQSESLGTVGSTTLSLPSEDKELRLGRPKRNRRPPTYLRY